jgi:hypothetical protein
MTYYLKPGDTLLTIDGSNGHTVYQDYTLTKEIPLGIYTDGINKFQLSEGGNYNIWSVIELGLTSNHIPVSSSITRTDYWNLKLCSDNSNATFQIDNNNLEVGVVLKSNDSGICYITVNQGALVGPLLTNYYETGGTCLDCLSSSILSSTPTSSSILLPTSSNCRSYDYIGGVNGGTINYTPCGGGSNIEINVFENGNGSFCSIDNQFSTSGNITIITGDIC